MYEKPLDIVIVGGSLSSLLHALVLKHHAQSIRILEKSLPSTLSSEAAGIRAGPAVHSLIQRYIKNYNKEYAHIMDKVELVNGKGEVLMNMPQQGDMYFTTWRALWRMFREAFLEEDEREAENGGGEKKFIYETGMRVDDVREVGEKMEVVYPDLEDGSEKKMQADLVIAADGANSRIRRKLIPDLAPEYVGYITWRGSVPESEVSDGAKEVLANRVVLFRTDDGYIVSYYVPSENPTPENKFDFIWVWYQYLPFPSQRFQEIFTDTSNMIHTATIPRGKMQPKIWSEVLEKTRTLPPAFSDVISKTQDPFVSAIRELPPQKSVFYEGKLVIVGDALTQCRPHTAIATDLAAGQALGLEKVVSGEMGLEEWEKEVIEAGRRELGISKAFGEFCLMGEVPEALKAIL